MTMRYLMQFFPVTDQEAELACQVLAQMKGVVDGRAGYAYPASAVDGQVIVSTTPDGSSTTRAVTVEGWTHFNPDAPPMCFGSALAALKSGKKVARSGWNGKGMWVRLIPGGTSENGTEVYEALPYIGMKTADDKFVPWLANQTDLLAEDWVVVESPSA